MTRKTQTIANVNRKQGRAMGKALGPIKGERETDLIRQQELEAKMAAWIEAKGERPTDTEINELCNLRKTSK